jgi:hypothetical protein
MKFSFRPGKAKDEGKGDYSRIPDNSPQESHELAGDIARAVTTSGAAQPGPSGHSRSRRLEEAENLRARARKKGKEREELLEQAQKARASGASNLAKTLTKVAKMCWNAMKWLNRKAGRAIYRGGWWRVGT